MPFNSNANHNVFFRQMSREDVQAQSKAFSDILHWRTGHAGCRLIFAQTLGAERCLSLETGQEPISVPARVGRFIT